ncbi:MAG: triose-phosphate isomerase [Bacteroidales bacterium]|nr:triose-phosphate isomerase [Bacteroidales bacterium]
MRKKIVAGNWKMNTTVAEGIQLTKEILLETNRIPKGVDLVIAPPFTHLFPVSRLLENQKAVSLAAQNCAEEPGGAFTGEVSATMLASVPCEYVIVGHSERRTYYQENDRVLLSKINQVLANGMSLIFCVGERLEDREKDMHFQVVASQLREVICPLDPADYQRVIIAYEPVWAIGTGKTASADQAQEMHEFIRSFLAQTFAEAAQVTPILYGGSCKPSNAKELFSCPDIDGGLIGGASLTADDFLAIASSFA